MDYVAMVAHFAVHPDEGRLFNEAMADRAAAVIPTVIDAYDFGQFETIAEIGGGRGRLITAILDRVPTAKESCSTSRRSSQTPPRPRRHACTSSPVTSSPTDCRTPTPTC
jgi:hypothetical protein